MEDDTSYNFDVDELIARTGGAFKASALLNLRLRDLVIHSGPRPTREGAVSLIGQALAEVMEGEIALRLLDDDAAADAERSIKREAKKRADAKKKRASRKGAKKATKKKKKK